MKKTIYPGLLSLFLWGCKESDPKFEYVAFDTFKYDSAKINEGAPIQILSFSGGPSCTAKAIYYYQYIGINKENNDTVRILSPCQKIPDGSNPTEGSFSSWQEISSLIDKALKVRGENSFEEGDKVIVFNKTHFDIEKGNYKTAVGTLGFK